MGEIAENLERLKNEIPETVKLVAVSKTKPAETIMEAYNAGHRRFGENKAQELISKQPGLPADIQWHFIGHLQRNKVKYIAPFVSMIESVDSFRLLREINKQGKKNERVIDCLLQFHIATEESKFGLDMNEAREIMNSPDFPLFKNIRINGVMGMATFTDNEEVITREFRQLKSYFDVLQKDFFSGEPSFKEVSMGMTGDYHIAIREGSTMVRIGTAIFGERNY
jgi:hypothetical protein